MHTTHIGGISYTPPRRYELVRWLRSGLLIPLTQPTYPQSALCRHGYDHRGEMDVIDYYEYEDNFRCAVYSNTVYVGGRREEARGRACQQPDGSRYIID